MKIKESDIEREEKMTYLDYQMVESQIKMIFSSRKIGNKTYYLDKQNRVVATQKEGILTLYFVCHPNMIWSHDGIVVMAIINNFQLFNYKLVKEKRFVCADVCLVRGLCGTVNTLVHIDKRFIKETRDSHLHFNRDGDIQNVQNGMLPSRISKSQRMKIISFLKKEKKQMKQAKTDFEIGSISEVEKNEDSFRFKVGEYVIYIPSQNIFKAKEALHYNILKRNTYENNILASYSTYCKWKSMRASEIREMCILEEANYHKAEPVKVARMIRQ